MAKIEKTKSYLEEKLGEKLTKKEMEAWAATLPEMKLTKEQEIDLEESINSRSTEDKPGLSKSEITKLAIIELFKRESKGFVPNLSDQEEEDLRLAMESQEDFVTLKTNQDILNFTKNLALQKSNLGVYV